MTHNVTYILILIVITLSTLFGCSQAPPPEKLNQLSKHTTEVKGPIADLNKQIERFNAERPGDAGITPIDQRVSRVAYDAKPDIISCFDQNEKVFLTLQRQKNRRFKGELEVEFHEAPKPEGHEWGTIIAEFFLPEDTFKLTGK
jgi:hypothetical protein